jgi:BirA family biotin operon repressor/biotin-[acetyl-CoA-carboxylase] ligase
MEQLRSLGFAVVSVAGAGYRLERPFSDLVVAEAVLPTLFDIVSPESPWTAGLPYRYLPRCDSTNVVLKQVSTSTPSGMLVVTDEQTGGRGRLGRTWVSEPGKDLTFSVLLRPLLAPARAHLLSLAAALAVAEVLEALPGLEGRVGVKWPNDVLVGDEKVCGILLEGSMDADRLQWAVAGVGLNVNSAPSALVRGLAPEEANVWRGRPLPVSLREYLGEDVARGPLLASVLAHLTSRWIGLETEGDRGAASGADGILAGLRQRDALAGRSVEVVSGPPQHSPVAAGEALGIGPEGQLLVRSASGETVAVFAGDVTVRAVARSTEEPVP